jgi:outer membrane protein assembly factor BamB
MNRFLVALVGCLISSSTSSAADWPQFRGPRGDGCAEVRNLPLHWGGLFHRAAWQTAIPGTGWSSPIVVRDRVWLTSAEQTALDVESLQQRLAENPYGEQGFQAHASVTLLAVELDLANGRMLRQLNLATVDKPAPIHTHNSYASPTPVADSERVYCHFGSLGTMAVEQETGSVIWRQRFAVDDITGPGTSPVLIHGLLIVACDGADEQFVVAVDARTGAVRWRQTRPVIAADEGKLRRGFSTPLVIDYAGRTQVIAPGSQWVVAYEPASGAELWKVKFGAGFAVVPRPVFREGVVFFCTGYPKPELWAVRVDGSGDVTDTEVVWRYDRQVPDVSSPVIVGRELYFVSSRGIASCLDAESGEMVWQHRLGGGFAASPLAADGKLFFTSQDGTTIVLRPGRKYEELARNQLFGRTLASLAVAGEALLIRTDPLLYCLRNTDPAAPR